jgi:glycosyltransferase involved in cell wall biosynthesis
VCIVTPDLIGPVKNGGIGTHAFHLARVLASQGHAVSVLFTGPVQHGSQKQWQAMYRAWHIELVLLSDVPALAYPLNADWFVERSYRVFQYLRERHFDTIHFQDWQANGFHTVQAKRTTSLFDATRICVTTHSSTEWINEGGKVWPNLPTTEAKLAWCERYCCENADLLISPSRHMFEWATARGWRLAKNHEVAPYPYCTEPAPADEPALQGAVAFFGRLETRKGLELFVSAVRDRLAADPDAIPGLYFVGKSGFVADGRSGAEYISTELKGHRFEIAGDLDSAGALRFLKDKRAVAMVPSLLDNYPFAVLECCLEGIPVVAARTGGIPEMLPASLTFDATTKGMAAALDAVLAGGLPYGQHNYDRQVANRRWIEISSEPAIGPHAPQPETPATEAGRPTVSICTPYYNYGRYLDAMVTSLKSSAFTDFELIIVDDGSTQAASIAAFDALAARETDARVRYLRKANGGVGETRNFAAAQARGTYLIFMDADNLATPEMIGTLVAAIERAGVDVLTCHFRAFAANDEPSESMLPLYGYAPIGPVLEVGWIENVFGDANLIIRRSAFEAVGGFGTERHTSWEDWELLARLALRGYSQDVIPLPLFWYRYTPEGFSRNTSLYDNYRRVMRTFAEGQPTYFGRLLTHIGAPQYFAISRGLPGAPGRRYSAVATRIGHAVTHRLDAAAGRLMPVGSQRRLKMARLLRLLRGALRR